MIFRIRKYFFASNLASLLILGGCSNGTIFKEVNIDDGTGVSVDARQRITYVTKKGGPGTEGNRRQVVCAEPSPDAIVAQAAALAAQASGGTQAARGAAGVAASLSESAASIGLRTPTIQLLRDNLFRACEAYMNGAINSFQYNIMLTNMDRVMVSLLAVDVLGAAPVAPPVAIGTSSNANTSGGNQQSQDDGTGDKDQVEKEEDDKEKTAKPPTLLVAANSKSTNAAIGSVTINKPDNKHSAEAITRVVQMITEGRKGARWIAQCMGLLTQMDTFSNHNSTPTQRQAQRILIDTCQRVLRVGANRFEKAPPG